MSLVSGPSCLKLIDILWSVKIISIDQQISFLGCESQIKWKCLAVINAVSDPFLLLLLLFFQNFKLFYRLTALVLPSSMLSLAQSSYSSKLLYIVIKNININVVMKTSTLSKTVNKPSKGQSNFSKGVNKLYVPLPLYCHVSQSLWSNVSKVTSL